MDFQQSTQQQTSQQSALNAQPTSPIFTQPPKNKRKIIVWVIVGILALGGVSYGAYYFWPKNNQPKIPVTVSTTDETAEKASSLVSIDQTWNLYTNDKYGFSIKAPKKIYSSVGSMCEWKNDSYQSKEGFVSKGGFVPVKIFENENNIYIAHEYFYYLSGAKIDGTIKSWPPLYSKCEKIINTIYSLEDSLYQPRLGWKFVIKNINNDSELDAFIKEQYGSGCKYVGNKEASIQEGVYDVRYQGGKDEGDASCPPDRIPILKYYPAKNKAITWTLSMDGFRSAFPSDENYQAFYDRDMFDSFRFK